MVNQPILLLLIASPRSRSSFSRNSLYSTITRLKLSN